MAHRTALVYHAALGVQSFETRPNLRPQVHVEGLGTENVAVPQRLVLGERPVCRDHRTKGRFGPIAGYLPLSNGISGERSMTRPNKTGGVAAGQRRGVACLCLRQENARRYHVTDHAGLGICVRQVLNTRCKSNMTARDCPWMHVRQCRTTIIRGVLH